MTSNSYVHCENVFINAWMDILNGMNSMLESNSKLIVYVSQSSVKPNVKCNLCNGEEK